MTEVGKHQPVYLVLLVVLCFGRHGAMKHCALLRRHVIELAKQFNSSMKVIGSGPRSARLSSGPTTAPAVVQQPHVALRALPQLRSLPRHVQPFDLAVQDARRCSTVLRAASGDEADASTVVRNSNARVAPESSDNSSASPAVSDTHSESVLVAADDGGSMERSSAVAAAEPDSTAEANPSSTVGGADTTSSSSSSGEVPKLEGSLTAVWSTFLAQLWERGYFSEHTSPDR